MIKGYRQFIKESLLKLENNIDMDMIQKIESVIDPPSKILEISCGNGSDALYLKNLGFDIKATEINNDYVENAIKIGINCINHNTKNKFPFRNNEFDLTYSRLGLHYFTLEELEGIFSEIHRISKYLLFSVKLVNDIPTGKIILSKNDWTYLVEKNFNIISSQVKNGILYDNQSNWLEILAIKK